jgi:polyisoprenoid-binding protein YceI
MMRHRNIQAGGNLDEVSHDRPAPADRQLHDRPRHSRLGFVARHAMVTKIRGTFKEFEGTIAFDVDNPATSTAHVTISVASVDTRNAQRDERLRNNDLLGLQSHPEITFVATEFRPTQDALELTGDLTIRGVTRQITIPFTYEGTTTDPFGHVRVGFEGSATINRKDFGINWNAALEAGGVLVSDKVTIELDISAIKST